MTRIVFLFSTVITLLLAMPAGWAQTPAEAALLWKIEGKNSRISYLFGTIHLICPADFRLSPALQNCFQACDQLTLELDMDDPGMMMAMARNMMMKDNQKLKDLLDSGEYEQLGRFFQDSLTINIAMFDRVKPFMIMSMVLGKVLDCEPQSYEMVLTEMAKKRKINVTGLETVEEQMSVFDSIPYRDQAKMVMELIAALPKAREEFRQMVELYKKQDLSGLYKMIKESEFDLSGHEEKLLYDRNRRWISQIVRDSKIKSIFFAVGAAHLAGEKGLIALLQKEGYQVTPVF